MLPTFLRLDLSPSLSLFTDRSPPNLEFVICPPTTAVALLLKDFERGKSWIFASLCARVMPVAIYISKSYSRNPLSMTSSFILATFMCQLVRSAHRHTDFFKFFFGVLSISWRRICSEPGAWYMKEMPHLFFLPNLMVSIFLSFSTRGGKRLTSTVASLFFLGCSICQVGGILE